MQRKLPSATFDKSAQRQNFAVSSVKTAVARLLH
jgi:hypothetical protein